MAGLVDRCEAWPLVTSLLVGCSLGRGAADALSDIDAALGVDTPYGAAGAGRVAAVEAMAVAALPGLGRLVDVLRHRTGPADQWVRRIFAQFADGTQLDLAVVAEAQIQARRRGGGAPDFILLYQKPAPPGSGEPDARMPAAGSAPRGELSAAYAVTGEQVREWAFLGWCALIDTGKCLRRGSLGKPTAGCTRHATTSGCGGPWRTASCTHGTACRRCSTTTPGTCHRASSPPSPASTQPTGAAHGPVPEYSPRSAPPPPAAPSRPPPRPRPWPPTSPAHSPANPDREPSTF